MTEHSFTSQAGLDPSYLETLQLYFEEEIMGEAYFTGLADCFEASGQREKLILLAKVERHAAEAVRPLLQKYDLQPRNEAELASLEADTIRRHGGWSWSELISYMVEHYPLYMDDFEGLEKMAPQLDLPPLKFLTAHETAAIEFANLEHSGVADSAEPLRRYLAQHPPSLLEHMA